MEVSEVRQMVVKNDWYELEVDIRKNQMYFTPLKERESPKEVPKYRADIKKVHHDAEKRVFRSFGHQPRGCSFTGNQRPAPLIPGNAEKNWTEQSRRV